MNEEILSTIIYSTIIGIFLITFFTTIQKNIEINQAYFEHAKALQTINEIIHSGKNYEDYCEFIQTTSEKVRVEKGNEICQSTTTKYYYQEKNVMILSLPVLDDNEVVWVSAYA